MELSFEKNVPSRAELDAVLHGVMARADVSVLSDLEYKALKLALKPAIVADLKFSGKKLNEANFNNHPSLKCFTRS